VIKRGQVRRALSGAPSDDQLMLKQKGFGGDGANAAWSQEFGDRDDQVNREDEQIAHGRNLPHARIWAPGGELRPKATKVGNPHPSGTTHSVPGIAQAAGRATGMRHNPLVEITARAPNNVN
jgi:hypothetical protein